MHIVYLSLGSNLGEKEVVLRNAISSIKEKVGDVLRQSSFYQTEPWGFDSTNQFLNACICVSTNLTPTQLLETTQGVEKALGRDKKSIDGHYSDRVIDIDILLYDDLQLQTPELTIPHPLMKQRDFVMVPLKEILE